MANRTYPRQAWVLLPSFKPKEVTLTKQYGSWSGTEDWDLADSGKSYHKDSLFPSMSAAIAHGREQIEKHRADIAKRQATLEKRIAALDKASKGDRAATDRDGECAHAQCPQLRDNEPAAGGRHCPLDNGHDGD